MIFKRQNPRSLAKCIIRLINDNEFSTKLGEENFKYTVKNHTRETSEEILLETVEQILLD